MLFSFNIQITSFDGRYRLRLPKVILDGNGVNIVFDEGKDGILEPSYEGAGRINRGMTSDSVISARI
jgi:hypothetical protein